MKKSSYVIIVQWKDIFGDEHETEIPCTNEKKMNKQIEQLKFQYKYDSFVASFKIYGIKR